MMATTTKTGSYLQRMARGGHFKQKLGEASLALTECFCKADGGNRARLGTHLAEQMYEVLTDVYGWDADSAKEATRTLQTAFTKTEELSP